MKLKLGEDEWFDAKKIFFKGYSIFAESTVNIFNVNRIGDIGKDYKYIKLRKEIISYQKIDEKQA